MPETRKLTTIFRSTDLAIYMEHLKKADKTVSAASVGRRKDSKREAVQKTQRLAVIFEVYVGRQ